MGDGGAPEVNWPASLADSISSVFIKRRGLSKQMKSEGLKR